MIEWGAGLAGGCSGVLVGHPFDTVKVKLQTQDFRNPTYKGTVDCFRQTIRKNGVSGLFTGISSPLVGVGVVNAVIFGVQGTVAKTFSDQNALSTHFLSGVAAGFSQAFICSPVELCKTRLQIQADALSGGAGGPQTVRYKGPIDCLKQIIRTEGLRGVFKGQLITVMREIPAFGTYFLSYELTARTLSGQNTSDMAGAASVLLAGGMAGTASWIVSYPMDVIKTRIQSDGAFGPAKYKGIVDCAVTSCREEGPRVFTRGLASTIIRAFPTNAATFFVVSSFMKHFKQYDTDLDDSIRSSASEIPALVVYPDAVDSLKRSRKLSEIFNAGKIILQTASIAEQFSSYKISLLNKIKEHKLIGIRPVVLASAKEIFECSSNEQESENIGEEVSCDSLNNSNNNTTKSNSNCSSTRERIASVSKQQLEVILQNPAFSFFTGLGFFSQGSSLDPCSAMLSQHVLSLVV